jgi:hypothetical protein
MFENLATTLSHTNWERESRMYSINNEQKKPMTKVFIREIDKAKPLRRLTHKL